MLKYLRLLLSHNLIVQIRCVRKGEMGGVAGGRLDVRRGISRFYPIQWKKGTDVKTLCVLANMSRLFVNVHQLGVRSHRKLGECGHVGGSPGVRSRGESR